MDSEDAHSASEYSLEENNMEVIDVSSTEVKIKNSQRKTLPRMTKYEKAHVIGVRASQLSAGAPPFVDIGNESNPLSIANMELNEKKIPFIIRRRLPDNSFEDWAIDELMIPGVDFQ
ncbi:DNA-directed RNA polymerase [Encephalitozoon hellem]|uniref:DNA-directed RNA polymerases I, II, and III subunit RPABC2 n=1 Tax=Encephalitozoon hellem TaxID=27973 RepID=A0A9Q9F8J1_ENCHE|nr:DNA-directed RNA polymerase [Encephalitozoon hellem ATCC 50504]AFM98729.1 DNA-directed RNA polymerase [Encephalitozoon hellem ATCC 50504]KAG5860452.1 DNA-directed RNA polymerase [Encephalitozoon hellem]UTX43704.1 DNA-directed RNA polymerases I, II, and III subunit RPABC2 [Encephalitozoon hellem]WEL39180.1 DNA-directed RNA polymerases I, II, and III subunit RPABC2 [Encephalitozoon hellem]|eukprot:XP_003887710.1 DNA-directed RNA polymerase [Encephalitozoon hellem ATCC 50504]